MKKYITFDLDGTLMQNPFVSYVFPEIEDIAKEKGVKDVSVKQLLVQEHNKRMGTGRIVDAYNWDDIVTELFDSMNLVWNTEVEQIVKNHATEGKVYLLDEEVIPVLEQLRARGYTLVAATNGFLKYQLPVMDFLGLTPRFDHVLTPDITGYAKPDPRMLNSIFTDGQIVAHVGDRVDHDVYMANASGWSSIFITSTLRAPLLNRTPQERPLLMKKPSKRNG